MRIRLDGLANQEFDEVRVANFFGGEGEGVPAVEERFDVLVGDDMVESHQHQEDDVSRDDAYPNEKSRIAFVIRVICLKALSQISHCQLALLKHR